MKDNELTKLIEYQQRTIKDKPRDYIGASSIGSECSRQIWYECKGFEGEPIETKYRRVFDMGRWLETLVVQWLKESGLKIETGNEGNEFLEVVAEKMPYFKGHMDGVILSNSGEKYILEIKSAKDSSYKTFLNKGIELWFPKYYYQLQSYMGMSGIHSSSIIVLNKDTSDISDNVVLFDKRKYDDLKIKAQTIYHSEIEPPRINNSPAWYLCRICKFRKICHGV